MSDGDPIPSLFDMRTLTKDFYTLVPNGFLIFSVAILLTLILYSNNSFKKKPYGIFCFLKKIELDECGKPILETNAKTDPNADILDCPKMEELSANDTSRVALISYIMKTSYEVTHNATNSVIHFLLQQIQSFRIIPLYVLFYFAIKFLKDLIKVIMPFDLFKNFKGKTSSILTDFMAILMSVITLLFTICFMIANVIYFAFIFNKLANAKGHAVKLIPILFVMLLIIMFAVIIGGIKAQGAKKNEKYIWLFFMLIAFGVPFVATCHTIGYVLLSGFINVFTGRFTNERVAADKDTYNKYKLNEKTSKVGGAVSGGAKSNSSANVNIAEGPVAAAAVATAATVAALAAVVEPPTKSMNPLRPLYNAGISAYQYSVFKTQKGEDKPNFNFNKKARRIRKDAIWVVLGLGVLTSVLAMLDSSTKIMKSPIANNLIHKTRMVLI